MPGSDSLLDRHIKQYLRTTTHKVFLDIGIGSGKYGKLIRQHIPDATITGVEADESYLTRFDLGAYDHILLMDAANIPGSLDIIVDTVFFGDVIEHMRHSDGMDTLQYLLYRCRYIYIMYPDNYIQFSKAHPYENHRSLWRASDFAPWLVAHEQEDYLHLFVLRGLLSNTESVIPASSLRSIRRALPGFVRLETD